MNEADRRAVEELFGKVNVGFLKDKTTAELWDLHRKNGYSASGFEADNIEEAVAASLLDLVESWVHRPSSLKGTPERRRNYAAQRMAWTGPKHAYDERQARAPEDFVPGGVEVLREVEVPEPDRPNYGRRWRQVAMVKWALSELRPRDRAVLLAMHGTPDPPTRRALAKSMGVNEKVVRRALERGERDFRDTLEPWLCVLFPRGTYVPVRTRSKQGGRQAVTSTRPLRPHRGRRATRANHHATTGP